jgi:hypothetical protein
MTNDPSDAQRRTVLRIAAGLAAASQLTGAPASAAAVNPPPTGKPGDFEKKLWADYWVNSKSGVLTPPPSWGSFSNGAGTWDSDDVDGDKPIIVRGVWDRITPSTCRWYQALSRDDGRSWEETWSMDWLRA